MDARTNPQAIPTRGITRLTPERLRELNRAGKTVRLEDFEKMAEAQVASVKPAPDQPKLNAVAFFSQWLNSTGIPDFRL